MGKNLDTGLIHTGEVIISAGGIAALSDLGLCL